MPNGIYDDIVYIMSLHTSEQLSEARKRFRRNRNPGALLVHGLARDTGAIQQVLVFPERTLTRRDTVLKKDAAKGGRLLLEILGRGEVAEELLVMDSISTHGTGRDLGKVHRMNHMATSSSDGRDIARQLVFAPGLHMAASLHPESDKAHTRGLTGVITTGATEAHRVIGARQLEMSELYVHQPFRMRAPGDHTPISTNKLMLNTANVEPGVGLGIHAYAGVGRQPFEGRPYPFPLGSSAEDTLDIYLDLLGNRRGYNVAVKQMVGPTIIELLVENASGEPA